MYRYLLCILLIIGIFSTFADWASACEVKTTHSRYHKELSKITIIGTTTCKSGKITVNVYNASRRILGRDSTYISNYVFKADVSGVINDPFSINIEYYITQ